VTEGDTLLLEALAPAQRLGLIGTAPLEDHLRQARAMAGALFGSVDGKPCLLADLGSGSGLPGLPIAWWNPEVEAVLIEASERRADLLRVAVETLGLATRVRIEARTAEEVGRDPHWRGGFEAVVARSFGPPATTAECAAPLLEVGGIVVVAEPPTGSADRWEPIGETDLGLELDWVGTRDGVHLVLLRQVIACPERYPRATGVPRRRPLW